MADLWSHLNRRSSADMFRIVAELDSSLTQIKALFLLEQGGTRSVKEIAAGLSLSLPAASRAVDGMVQKGFVAREESADDRRCRLVSLTDKGREAIERVLSARRAVLLEVAAEIPDADRTALHAALLPIVERITHP